MLPELLLDELELLEELELLDELELLEELELLLELEEELEELLDDPVSTGGLPPPPHAVNRDAHNSIVRGGLEIAGFKSIRCIKAPIAIFVL